MHEAPAVKLMYDAGMLRRAALAALLLASGCKDSATAATAGPSAERIETLQAEEGHVLARRDALVRERAEVDAEREALDTKRKEVSAAGGDLKALDAETQALAAREARLAGDEARFRTEMDGLLRGYQQAATGATGKDVASREAQVALREKDFARREQSLAEREAQLATREREQARHEREVCPAPGPATVAAAPAVSRYSRKDVEPLLSSARRKMSEKGLLASDLPSPVRDLEREAASAMSSGDFARARFAADQLVATVEELKVDKSFIMAKIGRLNGAIKSAKIEEGSRKQADELFRDATADYGDGKFAAANGKLNRIYALLP